MFLWCESVDGIVVDDVRVIRDRSLEVFDAAVFLKLRRIVVDVKLHYISTNEQVVDIFTKSLLNKKLEYLRRKPGLVDISSLVERA